MFPFILEHSYSAEIVLCLGEDRKWLLFCSYESGVKVCHGRLVFRACVYRGLGVVGLLGF